MTVSPYNVKQKQPYQRPNQSYLLAGAITQTQGGIVFLEGTSARAMTLAAPNLNDDGIVLSIKAVTAQAHTVTGPAAGFDNGGSGADVATFGTSKGCLILTARAGVWYILSSTDVTLG